ncbi:MAG TPA: hypothetical protein DCZ92_04085, partial [Elusimicrobia bacterium]|nr:hypothetical protein [Elusimicrobiota bacterium]
MFTHFVDSAAADRSSLESKFPATAPTGEKIIYGDTDIIVFGRNSVNGGNKSGFYRIDYMIQNSLGETPVPARTAFVMGGEMDPSSSLLHTTYLAPPTSDPEDGLVDWDNYYNITNSGPALENVQLYSNTQTHAWQTKVLYGVVDDVAMSTSAPTGAGGLPAALLNHNPDGSTTYTPKYPDGKYKVLVKAYSYPLVNVPSVSTSWVWRDVIVDNARPYLERLEVIGPDDEPKYVHQWGFDGATLTRSAPTTYELIGAGDNTINLHFSEPVTGVTLAIDSFSDFSGFQSSEPAGAQQNFTGTFEVARSTAHDGLRRAAVTAKDLAGNELLALTTSQLTIAPSLQLTRNEAGALGGTGGADVSLFMIDTSTEPPAVVVFRPITITTYTEVLGECRGACYSVNVDGSTEPYVYLNRNTVQFMYADASGLGKLDVRRLSGEEAYANSFSTGMYVTTMTITLTDGIYRQTIADRLGNATTMYFYVDPAAPELTLAAINVDSLLQVEGITGTARDTASGLAYVVANPPMPGPLGHVYPGEPLGEVLRYDGTTAAVNWAFGGFPYAVGAAAEHYYYAEDRAGSMSWWPIGINSGKGNGISPSVLTTPANISSRLTEIDIDGSSDTGHACSVALTGTGLASPLIKGAPANTAHTFTLPAGESSAHYSTNFYLTGNINVTNGSGCQLQGIGGESGLLWFSDSAAGRMEEAPVGLSATLMTDHWSVKLASITQPGTFGALELPYVPPSGYFTYPPGDNQSLYVVVNGVAYQKAVISVPGVEGGQIAYDGVLMATSYDAASGKNFIELPHISSLFALLVPAGMYDNLAPVTKIARSYESGGLLYAGPRVRLRATDYGPSSATIAGVATSYYVLDGGLGACGLSPDPAACDGINTATGAFTVAEGAHLLSYASVDYAGNFELAVSSTIYVDATAPLTEVSAAGRVLSPESTENITETDEISLAAADPVSNGLASNVKGTRYYIDVATSSCTGYPSYTGPAGTCENPKYYGPFTLSAGTHTVYYASMDNVWNREEIKTVNFIVGGVDPGLDTVPPVVSAWANGQEIPDGGAVSVSTFAPITLTAVDDGSGVAYVFYSLDVQLSSQTAVVYSNPFVLGVGTHLLYYTARDNAGIVANIRTATITVIQSNQTTDTTPPVVVLSANGQAVPNGGGITITTFTAITLNATDDNSGVDGIFYSVDIMLSSQSVTVYTEPFMLPAGMHMVYYTATDKSGNMAGIQAATITVIQSGPPADTTPPVVSAWADGLEIPAGGTAEITSTMTVVLTATDDNTGADGIFYSVDIMLTQQTVQVYSAPFALAVGTHTLYYTAKDKAGNIAAIKNAAIAVTQAVQPSDTIPPVVSAWAAGLEIADGGAVAIEVLTPVTLTASDDNSGVAGVYYSVDAPLTQQTGLGYSAPLLLAAGTHVVYYVAKDNAGNVSAIRTANITVNPQPAAGGTYYVDGLAGNDNNAGDSSASAFRSLNRALSSAQAGSVIIISSGVYHESVFINVENITLLGQYGAVLDGDMNGDGAPDMQAGIMLNNTSGARIEGLAFHNYQTGLIAGSAAGLSVS